MTVQILTGDVRQQLRDLPSESVHCVVTSPPYWGLRDYGVDGQIGLEGTLGEHITMLVNVFREVRRVLRKDGTVWMNYGDAYAGAPNGRSASATKAVGNDDRTFRDKPMSTIGGTLKPKDRMLLPARVAIALQDDGWWVRDEIVWHKPNPMPSSVKDRTTPSHEMIYMLTKAPRYYFDSEGMREPCVRGDGGSKYDTGKTGIHQLGRASTKTRKVKVPGGWDKGEGSHGTVHRAGRTDAEYVEMEVSPWRNKRSVWTIPPKGFKEAHFATFPPDLIRPCILAGCPVGGTVLDPFFGAGTTGLVAQELGRNCIGVELNPDYVNIARRRLGLTEPDPLARLLRWNAAVASYRAKVAA